MEKIKGNITKHLIADFGTFQLYREDFERAIEQACQELQIDDLKSEGQRPWKAVCKRVGEIIFNDNEYIVSNPDEIEQIIRLCRQNWEPSNTHITKEDCDMCVKFIGTDTEVWVDTETLSSYIGESFVQMPEDLFKKIKEVVSLSNTPRPGKFVYKLMFLKFSRLIF